MTARVKVIQLPREAFQAQPRVIPTDDKLAYLNLLLRAGFDTVEVGSIANPRIMPQMADTVEILDRLDLEGVESEVMVLVLNKRGADLVCCHPKVSHISFPFSVSPEFLRRNTNSTVEKTLETTDYILKMCRQYGKTAVIYFSMAFGNPYGEPWKLEDAIYWIERLSEMGAGIIPLSNVGTEVSPEEISDLFSSILPRFPDIEFGLHLHTRPYGVQEKIHAAYTHGCNRFDTVLHGYGGCPLSSGEMTGNLSTQQIIKYFNERQTGKLPGGPTLQQAYRLAETLFN